MNRNALKVIYALTKYDESMRDRLREANGLDGVVKSLGVHNEDIQLYSAGILDHCSQNSEENRKKIKELNAVEPLSKLLDHQNEKIANHAANTLFNLTMNDSMIRFPSTHRFKFNKMQ